MNEKPNRTFVCSILFIDIVEYSKRSVAEQMTLKQRFNDLLGEVLKNVAVNDRIVLDTGDGAAVSFLGTPEDTLFAAIAFRDAIAATAAGQASGLTVRMGINLGPVRLIKDLNGQLNIIGDGINVAQRIMAFATPGQILVSRSYFEVVSRLAPEFSQLFLYEGARTDKHVREHEVYAVGPATEGMKIPAAAAGLDAPAAPSKAAAYGSRLARKPKLLMLLTLGAATIIGAGIAVRMQRQAPAPKPALPEAVLQEPAAVPPAPPSAAPAAAPPKAPAAKQSAASGTAPPRAKSRKEAG